MILHAEAQPGNPAVIQKTIKVNNVNNISVDATLAATGDIKDYTQILDSKLTLAPGESKDARFVVTLDYGGYYEGKILVNFRPSDSSIKATPVGLASTVIIIANGPTNPNAEQQPANETGTQPTPQETTQEQQPKEQPTQESQPKTSQPTQQTQQGNAQTVQTTPAASPIVGAIIIFIVLIIGAILYWWYIRR
jgi:hypothetical protein